MLLEARDVSDMTRARESLMRSERLAALQAGDLLGTGTLSGPTPAEAGALLELTQGGKLPVQLPNGEQRTFLQDGDEVVIRGWCEHAGAARIGFGECRGSVLADRKSVV